MSATLKRFKRTKWWRTSLHRPSKQPPPEPGLACH